MTGQLTLADAMRVLALKPIRALADDINLMDLEHHDQRRLLSRIDAITATVTIVIDALEATP